MNAAAWRPHIARLVAELWPTLEGGPRWIEAQVNAESAGDPNARSAVGAVGLLQLMPVTAREMGLRVTTPGVVDPAFDERLEPERNLRAGVGYLKRQFDQLAEIPVTTDRLLYSFAAYNAGRGFIDFLPNDGAFNQALEIAKRDDPKDWWRWDVGRYWLMHRDCAIVDRPSGRLVVPDYRQVWDYVARIRRYSA